MKKIKNNDVEPLIKLPLEKKSESNDKTNLTLRLRYHWLEIMDGARDE